MARRTLDTDSEFRHMISRQTASRGEFATARILLCLLVVGLVAASLYLVPSYAPYGLAVLGLGVPVVLLVWFRPEFGLLSLIFLTSSFVPANVVDLRLPIGGGLDLRDLVLIGMLGLLIFRGLTHNSLRIPWWPVGLPLILFLTMAIFSASYALVFQRVESNWALGELRNVIYYALFFVAAWGIEGRRQLIITLVGLFAIADLVAVLVVLQQLLGPNNAILAAMSGTHWHLWEQATGSSAFGTLRVVPPGHVLMYVMMIVAFCLMTFAPRTARLRAILEMQILFLGIGLFLTYTRAQWAASIVVLGLIAIMRLPAFKASLARYLIIGVSTLLIALPVVGELQPSLENSPSLNVLAARVSENTADWRVFETEEALRSISQHPILGVGLGNSYRGLTLMGGEAQGWWSAGGLAAGEVSRFTRYIHNSHLAIAVKMGVPALMTFLWFCTAYTVCGWRLYQNLADQQLKGLVLALTTSFLGLLFWAVLHSHLVETESTSVVGLMAGLLASVHCLQEGWTGSALLHQAPASRVAKGEIPFEQHRV